MKSNELALKSRDCSLISKITFKIHNHIWISKMKLKECATLSVSICKTLISRDKLFSPTFGIFKIGYAQKLKWSRIWNTSIINISHHKFTQQNLKIK